MAEQLGSGLQNRVQQCDSAPDLQVTSLLEQIVKKESMSNVLLAVQAVVSVLNVMVVLLQQKGTGLGGAFGGEGNVYRTRRGLERGLFTLTIVFAVMYAAIAGYSIFFAK